MMTDDIFERISPRVTDLQNSISQFFPKDGPASLERFIRLSIQLSALNPEVNFNQDAKKDLHIKLSKALHDLESDLNV